MDPDESIAELKARVAAISAGGSAWKDFSEEMKLAEDKAIMFSAAVTETEKIRVAKKAVAVDIASNIEDQAEYPDMNLIAAELERKNAAARAEVKRAEARAACAVKEEIFSGLRKSLYDSRYLRKADDDGSTRKTAIAS
jgi:hypothetical protein